MKGMSRILSGALVALLVGSVWAPAASGELMLELRTTDPIGGQEVGPVIPITPGQTVNLELWAVLTEAATEAEGELHSVWAGARSTDGGLVKGDLSLTPTKGLEIFSKWQQVGGMHFRTVVGSTPAPNAAAGTTWDHDGDGDQDAIGSIPAMVPNGNGDMVMNPDFYRNFMYQAFDPAGDTAGNQFFVAKATFETAGDWGPAYNPDGPSGATEISLIPGVDENNPSVWIEPNTEGVPEQYTGLASTNGSALLVIESQASADATPADQVVDPATDLVLDGSAATGSINWWRWEFDGDGVYDGDADADTAVETGEAVTTLTMSDLAGLGLGEGMHTVTGMAVGWVSSPAENLDTSPTSVSFEIVPEPATLALVGLGLAALAGRKRK
ncbi:MAG: PEP-CTERM sorting domain-containing protein [Phycisphaerae bacterium]